MIKCFADASLIAPSRELSVRTSWPPVDTAKQVPYSEMNNALFKDDIVFNKALYYISKLLY